MPKMHTNRLSCSLYSYFLVMNVFIHVLYKIYSRVQFYIYRRNHYWLLTSTFTIPVFASHMLCLWDEVADISLQIPHLQRRPWIALGHLYAPLGCTAGTIKPCTKCPPSRRLLATSRSETLLVDASHCFTQQQYWSTCVILSFSLSSIF